jgi:hypothetical protein
MLPLVAEDEVEVPERKGGQRLLWLGFDQLAAELRGVPGESLHRRDREVQRGRLEGGDSCPPGDAARGGGELGLRELGALEQRLGVTDQDERGVGQPHPATGSFEERNRGLALEHRELLGDGGGRELQRLRNRRDRAACVELTEEAQAVEVQHTEATLLCSHNKSESFLNHAHSRMGACSAPARSSASPRPRRSARWASSASSRTTRA